MAGGAFEPNEGGDLTALAERRQLPARQRDIAVARIGWSDAAQQAFAQMCRQRIGQRQAGATALATGLLRSIGSTSSL
jgi:hypothetical protein